MFDSTFWMLDSTLRPFADFVSREGSGIKVLSLDFFDTFVCRLTAEPVNLFNEVGRRLADAGHLPDRLAEPWCRLRIAAEARAREGLHLATGSTEVRLAEIYAELREVVGDPVAAAELELATERDYCFVNPYIASLVTWARERGWQVHVLSDIYLDSAALAGILTANGADVSALGSILTSSDHRHSKHDGRLFDTLARRLAVRPAEIVHIGDNESSDVKTPRRRGIHAFHYPRRSAALDETVARERVLDGDSASSTFAVDAVRTLAARVFPGEDGASRCAAVGATIFGPPVTAYLAWSLAEFRSLGIRRVFALMREGTLLGEIFATLAAGDEAPVEVVPVFVSRYATIFPSLAEITPSVLHDFVNRFTMKSVGDFVGFFGVDPGTIGLDATAARTSLDEPMAVARAVRMLCANPEAKATILDRAERERGLLVRYLVDAAAGESRVGVLDLGYAGTIQRNMQRALAAARVPLEFVGRYLATDTRAAAQLLRGADIRGYVGECGQPHDFVTLLTRSPEILEQALSAPVGSTLGYRETGNGIEPVLGRFAGDAADAAAKERFAEGLRSYVQFWSFVRAGKAALVDRHAGEIRGESRRILERLIAYPLQEEVLCVGTLSHDDNFGSENCRPICEPDTVAQAVTAGFGAMYGPRHVYWPQGCAALANPDAVRRLAFGWSGQEMMGALGAEPLANRGDSRHPRELTMALERLAESGLASAFCFVGWSAYDDREWVRAIARRTGRKRPTLHVPLAAAGPNPDAIIPGYAAYWGAGAQQVLDYVAAEAPLAAGTPCVIVDADADPAITAFLARMPVGSLLLVAFARGDSHQRFAALEASTLGRWLSADEALHGYRALEPRGLPAYFPFYGLLLTKALSTAGSAARKSPEMSAAT